MNLINEVCAYSIMLLMILALIFIPKAISEYRGLLKTTGDAFTGMPKPRNRWRHGLDPIVFVISCITIIPILVVVEEQIQKSFGLAAAALTLAVIVLPFIVCSRILSKRNQAKIDAMDDEQKYRY
ncbi:MAG: hypothetical protein BZ136_09095 [Methanosphaera sp. rholeuAM74]|nr:MAG: hypothetical protein BZ136_09095 [Methanosphaera sp. rholeuAM74]